MEEKVTKISFFKKIWYSITQFEKYPIMAAEGLKRTIKYLILLAAIISIFMTLCSVNGMKKSVLEIADYIQENIPEFTYSNGIVSLNSQETIAIEELDDTGIERIIINTSIESEEEKEKIQDENSIDGITAFFFNDKIILKIQTEQSQTIEQKFLYTDIITSFAGTNIEQFTKSDFIEYLKSGGMTIFYNTYSISTYISYFIDNILILVIYSLEVALLGWITTIILRIRMRFKALYNMSAYSITLSTILMTIYVVVNYFTGFVIKEMQIAYIAISYIYLVAAIFILKDDLIKKMQEVEQIKQEQLKVREEIKKEEEKQEDNKENEQQKNDRDDTKDNEPQGSES